MDQPARLSADASSAAFTVAVPHAYDGIGQALRCAYRDHRDSPPAIATILHELYRID